MIAVLGRMDMAMFLISADRLDGPPSCQRPCRVALPCFVLSPDAGDLDSAVALNRRAECGPRLDRLQLFGITDHDQLGAPPLRFPNHPFHLPRADHTGFVDHQDRLVSQQRTILRPLMLHASDRSRGDA